MFTQPFLDFGEEPITCSKSSNEDDMLGSCQFIKASQIYAEWIHRYITVRRFPLIKDRLDDAVDRGLKELSNIRSRRES